MYCVELQWKEFNVYLPDVQEWVEANIEVDCLGLAANTKLEIYFESEPSQEEKDDIQAYWDGLTAESAEAANYLSAEDIEADRLAKAASAKAKLAALGLTEEEIAAILG